MEHSVGLILGLVLVVSFAGLAIAYTANYASNVDDEYELISNASIHRNSDVSIILISWTNSGKVDVTVNDITLLTDPEKSKIIGVTTKPHQSNSTEWILSNVPENTVLKMKFTFADGFESIVHHQLR